MGGTRIKDVAELAGVSTATVSHVINKTRFVGEETRQKVLAAIESIGYTPNMHARSLASGSSRTLGLIISDIANPFFPDLVKSIQQAALGPGYEVILANTDYESDHDVPCVQRLLEARVKGIMVMTTERDNSSIQRLVRSGVATVFLDVGKVGPHVSNIRVDYEIGIYHAVQHLLEHGHRRIAFIGGPERFLSAELRHNAFVKAMKKHVPSQQTDATFCQGDFKLESGQQAVRALLALEHPPTAFVAANDLMAMGALGELKRAGLHVPADVSVIGCDDIWLAAASDPPLTTISIPRAQIGRAAVEAVLGADDEGNSLGREIKIPTSLVVRQSTGPAAHRR
jgi:DNA-binding LacI/PurR family transcriptional regulator